MPKIRIATFNCENLFARFKFNKNVDPEKAVKEGFDINMLSFELLSETEKKLTAKAIIALDADVIALQEIENLDVLKRFRSDRLKSMKYTFCMLVDGNDPREIDVAVLSRFPLVATRSLGDLNDFLEPGQGTTTGIASLVNWPEAENVLERLPASERFTHFFERAPAGETKLRQLDYVLLSKSLAEATGAHPVLERRGLSPKATQVAGPRFPGVTAKLVASDHCPLAIDVNL